MNAAGIPQSPSRISGLVRSILSEERLIEQLIMAVQSGNDAQVLKVSREIKDLRLSQADQAAAL